MSEPISLDRFRKKKQEEQKNQPVFVTLVWLYCPHCKKIEYSEILAPNGRKHSCGTQVYEEEVAIDVQKEVTIINFNLQKLEQLLDQNKKNKLLKLMARSLDKNLQILKSNEETYLARLQAAAHQAILPLEGDLETIKEQLVIKEVNALGLWISEFRYQPEKRFQQYIT